MATRKPKIEYYWTPDGVDFVPKVNWRLVGADGEVMCHSHQGFRDRADARRSVDAVTSTLFGTVSRDAVGGLQMPRHVGPGKKPS